MKDELERIWHEVVVVKCGKYYPGTCLEGLRKTAKTTAVRTVYLRLDI
jgi:hypothetical protein